MSASPRPLRVLFDVYELQPDSKKSLGIYNYAKNLFGCMIEMAGASVEMVVACNVNSARDFNTTHANVRLDVIGRSVPGRLSRQLWMRGGAAARANIHKCDVYLSPKGFLPWGLRTFTSNVRSVVVVHDLIPIWYAENFPGHFGWLEECVVNRALRKSVLTADHVIAISKATAEDIRIRVKRSAGVSVVLNGVPFAAPGPPPLDRPYIFAITSGLPHKNATGVLDAYRQYRSLVRDPLPLLVCGVDGLEETGVMTCRGLTDSQLHGCYANARLFVFLSLIEGFGFPPVEAMLHGTQVVCSDIPSLREVTREAAHYVCPRDSAKAGMVMAQVLDQPMPDKRQVADAVSFYNWESCAEGVLECLKYAVRSA